MVPTRTTRALVRDRRFSATVVGITALSVASVTAFATLFDTLVLRPVALPDADRLVRVWTFYKARNLNSLNTSIPKYRMIEAEQRTFSSVTASSGLPVVLTRPGAEPERLSAMTVTRSFIPTLGLSLARGRNFAADEDVENGPHVAIITRAMWESRFGRRDDILDRAVDIDGTPTRVVGVLAEPLPASMADVQLLLPWPFSPPFLTRAQLEGGAGYLLVTGRLRPGVTVQEASTDVATIGARYAAAFPSRLDGTSDNSVHAWVADEGQPVEQSLLFLLGGATLVMLIGSVNVSTLFLNRWLARQSEAALRLALGASGRQVAIGFVAEAAALGAIGCVAGAAVAAVAITSAGGALPSLPANIGIDARALAVTVGVALVATLLVTIVPARRVSRVDLAAALRGGSRTLSGDAGAHRLRAGMIVAEVALSAALLVVATASAASWRRLRDVSPGFQPAGVASVSLGLNGARYGDIESQRAAIRQVLERAASVPGVTQVAAAQALPMAGGVGRFVYAVRGAPIPPLNDRPVAYANVVTADYFATLGVPITAGRGFDANDDARRPAVCLINASFARRLFGDSGAVGHVLLRGQQADVAAEIVGVVGDIRTLGLDAPVPETIYLPYGQASAVPLTIVARTGGAPEALGPSLRAAVRDVDPTIATFGFSTLDARLSASLGVRRMATGIALGFAAAAWVLAVVGIIGVTAHAARLRAAEIGIRLALGAQRRQVASMLVGDGMRVVGIGLAIGIVAGAAVLKVAASTIPGAQAGDVPIAVSVVLAFGCAAALASLAPAIRATGAGAWQGVFGR